MSRHRHSARVLNGATSRWDRWLRALEPGRAPVDGRSLEELLAFAPQFGQLIHFYDLRDEPDGDWSAFFLTDPTLVLASIQALDLARVEADYEAAEHRTRATRTAAESRRRLGDLFRIPHGLGRRVDLWLKGLSATSDSRAARRLRSEIVAQVERGLGDAVRRLEAYDRGAADSEALEEPIGLDYGGFGGSWKLGRAVPDSSIYRVDRNDEGRASLRTERALQPLRSLFQGVVDDLEAVQSVTEEQLAETLEAGDQAPQAALYIAFVQLFRAAQDTVNTVAFRYPRFYYRKVLREGPQAALPDRLFLTFTQTPDADPALTTVPRDTLFPAGEDADGNAILFTLEGAAAAAGLPSGSLPPVQVSAASLARIRTLRLLEGALFEPGDGSADDGHDDTHGNADATDTVPQRILATTVTPEEEPADGWPTFGRAVEGTTETGVTEAATWGFALATPYLLLTGGERTIGLTVLYPEDFATGVLEPRLDALAAATGMEPEAIWRQVLEEAFRPSFSTAAGWFPYEGAVTATPGDGGGDGNPSFTLGLTLPASAPAVEGYDPEADTGDIDSGDIDSAAGSDAADGEGATVNPAPGEPSLKLYLRQRTVTLTGSQGAAEVYPLSLLAGLEVLGFGLSVQVDGLPVTTLANTDGEIDPESPFPVFGGVPTAGSYLQLSHAEIFSKIPQALTVDVRWFNLPPNTNGFQGWYRDYVLNLDGKPEDGLFDNTTFRGAFRLGEKGPWWLQEAGSMCDGAPPETIDVYLFRTYLDPDAPEPDIGCDEPQPTADGRLCPSSRFALEACPATDGPPPYYDPADGALRLTLTEPPYAFGNDLYAQNVLKAVIDDLPNPQACQDRCEAECAPLQEAAAQLADCIARCQGEEGGTAFTDCIQPCLERCQDILVTGALLCVLRCLTRWIQGLPAERTTETHRQWQARVQACRRDAPATRARILREVLEEIRRQTDEPDPGACFDRCWLYLQGYFCIADCADRCRTDAVDGTATYDKACLTDCLTLCQEQLAEAYGTCVSGCVEDCTRQQDEELHYPNEPYLPQAEAVTLSYSAAASPVRFFHLLPFDGYQTARIASDHSPPLLPPLPAAGNLYLGFSQLLPPQRLSLLVQMTTALDTTAGVPLPAVAWQILDGDTWRVLDPAQIPLDTTDGLENTGLLTLDLPRYDATDHTVAPAAYQWLRAVVDDDAGRFPHTLALTPHAGLARWLPNEEAEPAQGGERLREPIPAGTITSALQDLADIETIDQPMASFGGRPPEDRRAFELRLGERLRHKDRAILGWDYERLVLERFPAIWKVAVLPTSTLHGGDVPGAVLVVVVPGPDMGEAVDPTAPRAPGQVLREIQSYLEARTSPFVELRVVDPVYVRITVTATVEFRDDGEGGGSIGRLDQDLVAYLSPWFYDARRAATDGRYASEADITEFVRTRSYVQRLVQIDFAYSRQREDLDWYFLTSARGHAITEVRRSAGGANPPCEPEVQRV